MKHKAGPCRRALQFIAALAFLVVGGCIGSRYFLQDPIPEGFPTPVPEGDGWLALLEGDHAAHWENVTDDKDIFELEGGLLHIFGRTLYPLRYVMYTGRAFSDFELHVEFKLAPRANSGLFLRTQPNAPVYRGFEIQILDDHGKPPGKNGTGGVYDVVTPMFNPARPAGEWNSYDVKLEGTELTVTVNGWKVVDTDFSMLAQPLGKFDTPYRELPLEGYISFQDHGGEIWIQNLRVRPLDAG